MHKDLQKNRKSSPFPVTELKGTMSYRIVVFHTFSEHMHTNIFKSTVSPCKCSCRSRRTKEKNIRLKQTNKEHIKIMFEFQFVLIIASKCNLSKEEFVLPLSILPFLICILPPFLHVLSLLNDTNPLNLAYFACSKGVGSFGGYHRKGLKSLLWDKENTIFL